MRVFLFFLIFLELTVAKCDKNAQKLVQSYKGIVACKNNYIIFKNGKKLLYDDGEQKSFFKLLNNADIEDMFVFRYPKNFVTKMPLNYDPGRIRNEAFFKMLYGNSPKEVEKNLVYIPWFGGKIKVTKKEGAAKALEAVYLDLKKLPPKYYKYLFPIGGTYKWRYIAGTKRLSVHSFGAAIDINVKYSAYWRWQKGAFKNKIPKEIVQIFEKHGFIWGGKWYHFDSMHFEYRPELVISE